MQYMTISHSFIGSDKRTHSIKYQEFKYNIIFGKELNSNFKITVVVFFYNVVKMLVFYLVLAIGNYIKPHRSLRQGFLKDEANYKRKYAWMVLKRVVACTVNHFQPLLYDSGYLSFNNFTNIFISCFMVRRFYLNSVTLHFIIYLLHSIILRLLKLQALVKIKIITISECHS